MNNSGIYQITNVFSGKKYIGSAVNIKGRFHTHKSTLKNNKHDNSHLQKSWNKHGEESFTFEVLAKCPKEYLIKMEQFFINTINPEYNICRVAGSSLGVKCSNETKRKMSCVRIGSKRSDETKRKMSENHFKSVQIYQYTADGYFIKSHRNISKAAEEIGVRESSVRPVVRGKNGRVGLCMGFQFKDYYCEKIPAVLPKTKSVNIYKDGVFIANYKSLADCAKSLKINSANLANHVLGRGNNTVGGYTAKLASVYGQQINTGS